MSTFFNLIFNDLFCRLQEKQKHCKCSAKVIFALTTVRTKEKRDQMQAGITRRGGTLFISCARSETLNKELIEDLLESSKPRGV